MSRRDDAKLGTRCHGRTSSWCGRTQELAVDETRSSLLTVSDGRVVRVLSFADPEGAREAAGLPP